MERISKCVLCRPTADYRIERRSTELTLLHPAGNGINRPFYAEATGIGRGYFKNCGATDRAVEELEVWIAFLGSRLQVKMADTWLVLSETGEKLGCFSVDVADGRGLYVTAEACKNSWLTALEPIPRWAVNAASLYAQAPKVEPLPEHRLSVVDREAELMQLLQFVYGVLSRDGQYDLRTDFCNMALLDCLLWQKDRNMQSFGLVYDAENGAEMSGLYDSASITLPGLAEEAVGFCNILTTPQLLRRCVDRLFESQSRDFHRCVERFRQQEGAAFDRLQRSFLTESYCRRMQRRMSAWFSDGRQEK